MTIIRLRDVKTGSGQTTDASPTGTALATFDVTTAGPNGTALQNCSIFVTARCSGFTTTNNACGEWIGAAFKVVAGTLSQVGTTNHAIAMIKDTGGAPNSDFTVAGNIISYYVTGVAATTIDWFGGMEVFISQPV